MSVTGGLAALVFGLVKANQWGWGSASIVGVFVAATVLLGVFVVLQIRGCDPLVPPRLFQIRTLVGADLGMLLVGAGVLAMFFFHTLCMQQVLHYSAVRTGFGYLAVTATSIPSATIGSRGVLGEERGQVAGPDVVGPRRAEPADHLDWDLRRGAPAVEIR